MLQSQKRLQKWLSKPVNADRCSPQEPLVLSKEMIDFLDSSTRVDDETNSLPSIVASTLSKPLDGMSVYCPNAAILASKFAASRLRGRNTPRDILSDSHGTFHDELKSGVLNTTGEASSLISSLNVEWLKRRAELEKRDGNLTKAAETLGEAVDQFLGTKDYSTIQLREPVELMLPAEVIGKIEETYFLFDAVPHIQAGRIQRFLRKRYLKRCTAAVTLAKYVRGFLTRRVFHQRSLLRKQCALLVQKIFRRHFRRLCSIINMIQRWYRCRKTVREFRTIRNDFRMARRVQKLFRGRKARKEVAVVRSELLAAELIQRSYRSYTFRRRRSFGVVLYHRYFFFAARCIQTLIRRVQSTGRVKLRLINELVREDERMERERISVSAVVRLEALYARQYMRSQPGRLHKAFIEQQLQPLDNTQETAEDPDEVVALEASICFDVLDYNCDCIVSLEDLDTSLRQLLIALPMKDLRLLASTISPQFAKGISRAKFIHWWCASSNDNSDDEREIRAEQIKRRIKSRLALLESRGQLAALRADRRMTQMLVTRATTSATLLHRRHYPPKYQCCQCLEPFVLFTDYFAHHNETNSCCVLKRKALFSRRFWFREDWQVQRECEQEVMQQNEEKAAVSHRTTLQWFSQWATMGHFTVAASMSNEVKALATQLAAANGIKAELESVVEKLCDLFDLCGGDVEMKGLFWHYLTVAIAGDHVSLHAVDDMITREKVEGYLTARHELATENRWGGIVKAMVALPSSKGGVSDSHHKQKLRSKLTHTYVRLLWMLFNAYSKRALCAAVHRIRFPHKTSLSDDLLDNLGLCSLTAAAHSHDRSMTASRVVQLREKMDELSTIAAASGQKTAWWLPRLSKAAAVDPEGASPPDAVLLVRSGNAQDLAEASTRLSLEGPEGKKRASLLSDSLYAIHQRIYKELPAPGQTKIANLRYLFFRRTRDAFDTSPEVFSSSHDAGVVPTETMTLLPIQDIQLIEQELGIRLDRTEEYTMLQSIGGDDHGELGISLEGVEKWVKSGAHIQYGNIRRKVLTGASKAVRQITGSEYHEHAKELLIMQSRKLAAAEACVVDDYLNNEESDSYNAVLLQLAAVMEGDEYRKIKLIERMSEEKIPFETIASIFAHAFLSSASTISRMDAMEEEVASIRALEDILASLRRSLKNSPEEGPHLDWRSRLAGLARSIGAYTNDRRQSEPRAKADLSDPSQALVDLAIMHFLSSNSQRGMRDIEAMAALRMLDLPSSRRQLLASLPGIDSPSVSHEEVLALIEQLREQACYPFSSSFRWPRTVLSTHWHRHTRPIDSVIFRMRQKERDSALDAISVMNTGVVPSHSTTEDSSSSSFGFAASITRCQLVAMKQVSHFMRGVFGRLVLAKESMRVEALRRRSGRHLHRHRTDISALIEYAFELHQESNGVLITEIPFMIRYLVEEFGVRTTRHVAEVTRAVADINCRGDIYRLSLDDVKVVLLPVLQRPKSLFREARDFIKDISSKVCYKRDCRVSINSRARQQAVALSLGFECANESETLERCFALGLHAIVRDITRGVRDRLSERRYKLDKIPRAALSHFLESQGFTPLAIVEGGLVQPADYLDDTRRGLKVSTSVALANAISAEGSRFNGLRRRLLGAFGSQARQTPLSEVYVVAEAISFYREDICQLEKRHLRYITEGIHSQ